MKVKITLTPQNRKEAMEMMEARGIPYELPFEGPVFNNVDDYEICEYGVFIKLVGGDEYFYPLSSVSRVAGYGINS